MMRYLCSLLLLLTVVLAGAAEPAGKVEVIMLKPNKILYDDGEAGTASIRLLNTTEQDQQVTLRPMLFWDLEESRKLPDVAVTVPAGTDARAEIPLPAPTARYGHEIRVDAVIDGAVEDTGRQFFGVNSNWMDHILISFKRRFCELSNTLEPFFTYTTVHHWFAWAPGDYAQNAPDYDEWYSGQTGYHMKKADLQQTIKDLQAQGIHCTFYNNSFTNGKAGLEWARRHPEWICRRRDGTPMINGDPIALTKPYSDKATGQMGGMHMAFYDLECIEWGARNVLESIEMFGWDGMFWDCGGPALFPGWTYDGEATPHGKDPNQISARNYRVFHELIREKHPKFGVWINGSIDHYRQPFWSQFGNGGGMATAEDQLPRPQTTLLVEHRHHSNPGGRFNKWQYTQEQYAKERDTMTQVYGTPIIAGYTVFRGFPAQSHLASIILASQMRPANCHQEGSWPITQFMTRYSALLWRRDIKVVQDFDGLLAAETSRPVWWERYVYRRPTDQGEDIMVHFVNKPVTETCDPQIEENPPAATATIRFTVPEGRKLVKIYALQPRLYRPGIDSQPGCGLDVGGMPATVGYVPDPDNPGKHKKAHVSGSLVRGGPSQVSLPVPAATGTISIEVPEFVYHTLLVFRLEG